MLLDTGDALVGGGRLGDPTQGRVPLAGMTLMGYDAMALGPIELSLGPDVLGQRLAEAGFPMLSANAVLSGTGQLVAEPYAILEVGGRRLGVIGLTRLPARPLPGFQVLDPPEALAQYVAELAGRAETIIVLTNVDYRTGLDLAAAVPGIDLLIAALPEPMPTQAVRASGTGTLVVTAEQPAPRHTGRRVGRLLVTLEGDGSLSGESWASEAMDNQLVDDPLMTALLDEPPR